jgi:hypothetical protein
MIIYNVTINIADEVHQEWLEWMKTVHIPEVMQTGYFTDSKMLRLLTESAEAEGTTYAIQYTCKTMADLESYQKNAAPALQAKTNEKYKGKFVAFRSILEVV